ncbi:MAG: hypothetical protein ABJA67_04750 [Chthonomonadales bacterium]
MSVRTRLYRVVGVATFTFVMAAGLVGSRANAQTIVDLGLSKNVNGHVELVKPTTWKVMLGTRVLEMFHQLVYVSGVVQTSGTESDELPTALNGKILIRWEATGRSGRVPFGTMTGIFIIEDGTTSRTEGTLVGTFGCGTHRKPLGDHEGSRELNHFEGTLSGNVTKGPLKGEQIAASFAGKFTFSSPTSITGSAIMTVDGVHVQPIPTKK